MPRILESTFIDGPAGRLEALHEGPDEGVAIERAAVVCHPHPLYGGTLRNKVVFRLARGIRTTGAAVIRFNFRGVGASEGVHDDGKGERQDLRAVVRYARERYPELPLIGAGFSFGASVGIRVACRDQAFERFIAAGLPVDRAPFGFLAVCKTPKIFVHSTHDEYGSRENLEQHHELAAEPKALEWIEAEDHFFGGALDEFEERVREAATREF